MENCQKFLPTVMENQAIELLPTDELRQIARRIVWFESPEQALANPVRFVAYAMRYATFEDMEIIRKSVTDEQLRMALRCAPPGIIDLRSWAYWHVKMGIYPPPEMPVRKFE